MKVRIQSLVTKTTAEELESGSWTDTDDVFEVELPEGTKCIEAEKLVEEHARNRALNNGAMLVWFDWSFVTEPA